VKTPDWLPNAELVRIDGRGEMFVRVHRHPDPAAPALLLLHGWSASADTQWVFAYEQLIERYTVVAVDHHGHGRGLRNREKFELTRCARDAADVVRALGIERVILVGYSMGGPIALHLARDHADVVDGIVFVATALEWRATFPERLRWRIGTWLGPMMRSWWYPRMIRKGLSGLTREHPDIQQWVEWLTAEVMRNDTFLIASAGHALSKFDARPWAPKLVVPTAVVKTTRDRLVTQEKQNALAAAMHADVFELSADHLCTLANPVEFGIALERALDNVVARVRSAHS